MRSLFLAVLAVLSVASPSLAQHRDTTWANPVDIVGDADGPRYAAALNALADDRGVGAVLAMNVIVLSNQLDAAPVVAQSSQPTSSQVAAAQQA